jgi:hypothetical protein
MKKSCPSFFILHPSKGVPAGPGKQSRPAPEQTYRSRRSQRIRARHVDVPGDAPSSVRPEEAPGAWASRVVMTQAHVFLSSTRRFLCLFSVSWRSGLVGRAGAM